MSADAVAAADQVVIEEWRPDGADAASIERDLDMLAEVLRTVVYAGAGVSFIVPFPLAEARAFWVDRVLPGVRARSRRVLVARIRGRIVGTVQLEFAWPPNQPHRADVGKLLVHPMVRRRGMARALMLALEALARVEGRTLLVLDTWTDSPAETLYRSLGYTVLRVIPRFARSSTTTSLDPATFMYKELDFA